MRVLQIGADPLVTSRQPHGAIFELDQARALASSGHEVRLLSAGDIPRRYLGRPYKYPLHEAEGPLQIYRRYRRFLLPARSRDFSPWLAETHQRMADDVVNGGFRPDIVHAHNLGGAMSAARIARGLRVPYVSIEHRTLWLNDDVAEQMATFWRRDLADCAGVACVGEALRRSFAGRVPELEGQVRVIPNVVDERFFENRERRMPFAGPTRLAIVGYLKEIKGHALLLRAFARVYGSAAQSELHVVGDGPLMHRLKALSEELGIARSVRWHGAVSRAGVVQILGDVTALAVASSVETFSVAAIEALASGRPVISTKCGGPEYFVRESDGVLANDHSIEAMSAALREYERRRPEFDPVKISDDCRTRFGRQAVVHRIEAMWTDAQRLYSDRQPNVV